jgi:hypothetical protein
MHTALATGYDSASVYVSSPPGDTTTVQSPLLRGIGPRPGVCDSGVVHVTVVGAAIPPVMHVGVTVNVYTVWGSTSAVTVNKVEVDAIIDPDAILVPAASLIVYDTLAYAPAV